MRADIEPLSEVVRVWDDKDSDYGDHYKWFCGLRWLSYPDGEIELVGITKRITPEIWDALMEKFESIDVKRILCTSYPDGAKGKVRKIWIDVPSPFMELWRIKKE